MSRTAVLGNLIGSSWLQDGGEGTLKVANPADVAQVVGIVPAMSQEDVQDAYAAAQRGADTWRRTGVLERGAVLAAAARLLRERSSAIAEELVGEMGKTLGEAKVEATKAADFFDYYASLARLPQGQELADGRPGVRVAVRTEPVGIVLAITPWNDPLLTPARKLAPALFAGNAVILKPASETPLVALRLAAALHDAGLPEGALGTVTGRAATISPALLGDPRLDAVSFTGSTAVGMRLRRELSDRNVRLQTEMGGKNASVVLADADLDLAADTIAAAAFGQAGQRCTATSRVIVERAAAEGLVSRLISHAQRARLGPGLEPATTMGPLVSRSHQTEVLTHLERARAEGARVLTGGDAPADPELACGCYVLPTVLGDATPEMSIWREEVFGPVVAVLEVDDLERAVAAVNDSRYGLSAAVFTSRLDSAAYFEEHVDAGQVAVNLPTSGWDVHHPFGGFNDSGSAFKEQGLEGLRFYTRVKTVAVRSAS